MESKKLLLKIKKTKRISLES